MTDRFEVPDGLITRFRLPLGYAVVETRLVSVADLPVLIRAEVERFAIWSDGEQLTPEQRVWLDARYGPAPAAEAEAPEPTPGPVVPVREAFLRRVGEEVDHAYRKHGAAPWVPHQFYGILLEEVDEVWEAIKKDAPLDDVLAEIVQVAAVCLRYAESIGRIK